MPTIFAPVPLGERSWDFRRTCIFGVVNVTPDSFFDGGQFLDPAAAITQARVLEGAGADVLDVGGESTRPGAAPVPPEEELHRVIPVLEGLRGCCRAPLSIDTTKAAVAREAVKAGATIINDISGLRHDPEMAGTVAQTGASVILGHLRGRSATMQQEISFVDVVGEVIEELRESVRQAVLAGVRPDRIWIDPGIGFGKTTEQSLALLRATRRLREEIGYPVMVGPSRKSFIGAVTGQPAAERLMGSCAAVAAAVVAGADAVRVHDVSELLPAVRVADAIRGRNAALPGGEGR